MSEKIKSDLISSYIDNEITSKQEQEKLKEKLEQDNNLNFEFITHSLIKKEVNNNYSYKNLSQDEQSKLLNKIRAKEKTKTFNFKGIFNLKNLLFNPKRKLAFGFFTILLIVTSFFLYNSPFWKTNKEFALSQIGNDNMYVQAISNFNNLVDGKLPIQFKSNNPIEIEKFFKDNGVNYPIHIALYKNFELFGAIISQYNGVKLAQHVYKDKNGKMLYVFQVDEQYFKENHILTITSDLYNYVENGNSYKTYQGNLFTVLMKVRNNICAVISDLPPKELPKIFRL